MKPYTVEIEIGLPRDQVIELFNSSDNLFKWQTGLQSFEHVSGEPGQDGAKSKLIYINGKHRIELIETVTENRLPDEFNGTYEWNGGMNYLRNQFIELAPDRTKWVSTCEYKFDSLVLLWDVATAQRVDRLCGHAAAVSAVQFSSDDRALISVTRATSLIGSSSAHKGTRG